MRSLGSRPELVEFTERLSAPLAAELLSADNPPLLLDVRNPRERAEKSIEGSVSIPLNHLSQRAQELPKGRTILVHCAGGYRSSVAASLLQQKGFPCVQELAGGISAWEAAKLAVRIAPA
jgi:rhodanese-related sulfurtransferase